jgi:hypothetical protein
LVKVSEVCKVATPRLWSVDDLGKDSAPVDVIVWQVLSAEQIQVQLVRHILLNSCCALLRIRLISSEGTDKLMTALREIAVVARYRVRCEAGDSARHGDPISASESRMITLLYLPIFCARESQFEDVVGGDRGTAIRCAQGDEQNLLVSFAVSVGSILKLLPGGSVNGHFRRTGLPPCGLPSMLSRHRATFRRAMDGQMILPINSTFPHVMPVADVVIGDDRVVLKNGAFLCRGLLDEEMLAALGFSARVRSVVLAASLSRLEFQQVVWATEPVHSLSAQMLMIYSFILPMLARHAREMVNGCMLWGEVTAGSSTRGTGGGAPVKVEVVPVMGDSLGSCLAASTHDMVIEADGRRVTVPKGTMVRTERKRSCKPSELLRSDCTTSTGALGPRAQRLYDHCTGGAGTLGFQWQ